MDLLVELKLEDQTASHFIYQDGVDFVTSAVAIADPNLGVKYLKANGFTLGSLRIKARINGFLSA